MKEFKQFLILNRKFRFLAFRVWGEYIYNNDILFNSWSTDFVVLGKGLKCVDLNMIAEPPVKRYEVEHKHGTVCRLCKGKKCRHCGYESTKYHKQPGGVAIRSEWIYHIFVRQSVLNRINILIMYQRIAFWLDRWWEEGISMSEALYKS